jgi:transcriptional regulator with XRE-family HTH domain
MVCCTFLDFSSLITYFRQMSGYRRSRELMGMRLRELRRAAPWTGRQLAEQLGWHPSKISKIESGRQTASEADVTSWARACGAGAELPELLAGLRTIDDQYVEFRRMFRHGQRAKQEEISRLEDEVGLIRNFESAFVPGLLQTPEYARIRLAEGLESLGAPDDVDEAVAARLRRQQSLYRSDKRHHFVITEAVLRYQVCPPDVLAEQLDRLVSATMVGTLRFGIIPFDQPLPVAPVHGFHLYGDQIAYVEYLTGELRVTEPAQLTVFLSAFGQLAQVARYGVRARELVVRALTDITSTVTEVMLPDESSGVPTAP